MKRRYGFLLGLVLLMPSLAFSAEIVCGRSDNQIEAIAPTRAAASVLVNDEKIDLSECIIQVGKFFQLQARFATASAFGNVTALFNTDPFISFGATTTNLVAAPTTFSFLFGTPIVPGFYSKATSTGGVTVTNGLGGTTTATTVATSVVYPTYISGYGTLGLVPTNLGVDLGTLPCVAGPAPPFTATKTCSQGTTSSSFAPAFYDNLEALLTYTQDDIASVASWSGAVTLEAAVPEPASLTLLTMGAFLVGVGGYIRRRRI